MAQLDDRDPARTDRGAGGMVVAERGVGGQQDKIFPKEDRSGLEAAEEDRSGLEAAEQDRSDLLVKRITREEVEDGLKEKILAAAGFSLDEPVRVTYHRCDYSATYRQGRSPFRIYYPQRESILNLACVMANPSVSCRATASERREQAAKAILTAAEGVLQVLDQIRREAEGGPPVFGGHRRTLSSDQMESLRRAADSVLLSDLSSLNSLDEPKELIYSILGED